MINPFSVKTPETLTATNIATLFVDVFSDFPKILEPNHTFIHGSRGTGKSMMLRFLEPCVQKAAGRVSKFNQLNFFAIHIPIKTANYNITELEQLKDSAYWLLSEHFFITTICSTVVSKIILIAENQHDEITSFVKDVTKLINLFATDSYTGASTLEDLDRIFVSEKIKTKKFLSLISFNNSQDIPYKGTLFDYEEFFLSFIKMIKKLSFTPNGPVFVMLDDADNLNIQMQKILNTWVSYRTTNDLCLKISTQKKYKSWRTTQNILIESPHDFIEVDINSIYTSKQNSNYYNRIEKIIEKRLKIANIHVSPQEFFPCNVKQQQELENIKKSISDKWHSGEKRVSSRIEDDVNRYHVSEYMKELHRRKKSNLYSYAGFDSLVNISSGMIRYFLEPASRMYTKLESSSSSKDKYIDCIPDNIQDEVIKKWSEEFILQDLDKMRSDEESRIHSTSNLIKGKSEKLRNLIDSLGQYFRTQLLSDDSERRFLSFMLTKIPNNELQEVLDIAVEWGYFNIGSISKKEGMGRNTLYILNRRLAPYYKLDPTGYAAHASITPEALLLALDSPNKFLNARKPEILKDSISQTELDLG